MALLVRSERGGHDTILGGARAVGRRRNLAVVLPRGCRLRARESMDGDCERMST